MKKVLLMLCLSAASALNPAQAALPAAARTEIVQLMATLEKSDCHFNRNGNWYDGKQAASHLQRKFAYLEEKDMLANAEDFIKKGASESSSSGKPYLVRCQDQQEVKSADWFAQQLKKIRGK